MHFLQTSILKICCRRDQHGLFAAAIIVLIIEEKMLLLPTPYELYKFSLFYRSLREKL